MVANLLFAIKQISLPIFKVESTSVVSQVGQSEKVKEILMRPSLLLKSIGVLCAGAFVGSIANAQLLSFYVDLGIVRINDNSALDRDIADGVIVFDTSQWIAPPPSYWARGRVIAGSNVQTGAIIVGDVRIESTTAAGAADFMDFVITFNEFNGGNASEWANGRFEDVIPSGVPRIDRAGFSAVGQFANISMPLMTVGPIVDRFPIVPFDVGADSYMGVVGNRLSLTTNWYLGGWDVVDWPLGVYVVPGPSALAAVSLGLMLIGSTGRKRASTH